MRLMTWRWRALFISPYRPAGCLREGGGGAARQGEVQGVREGTRQLTSRRELEDRRERLSPATAAARWAVPQVEISESKV